MINEASKFSPLDANKESINATTYRGLRDAPEIRTIEATEVKENEAREVFFFSVICFFVSATSFFVSATTFFVSATIFFVLATIFFVSASFFCGFL
jgi:hypothetical protein